MSTCGLRPDDVNGHIAAFVGPKGQVCGHTCEAVESLRQRLQRAEERLRQMLLNGTPQADGRLLVERYSVERAWEYVNAERDLKAGVASQTEGNPPVHH